MVPTVHPRFVCSLCSLWWVFFLLIREFSRADTNFREKTGGRSNKEIGAMLYISELTVKGHVWSILEKLEREGSF